MATTRSYINMFICFQTEEGTKLVVSVIFSDIDQMDRHEEDYFDLCRPKIDIWLAKHYPGDTAPTDGEDFEFCSAAGCVATDDIIDFRV